MEFSCLQECFLKTRKDASKILLMIMDPKCTLITTIVSLSKGTYLLQTCGIYCCLIVMATFLLSSMRKKTLDCNRYVPYIDIELFMLTCSSYVDVFLLLFFIIALPVEYTFVPSNSFVSIGLIIMIIFNGRRIGLIMSFSCKCIHYTLHLLMIMTHNF